MPGGGRIIIIGSVMPVPGMASYALSKSALQGPARGLARDLGLRGITINIVQPGRSIPTRTGGWPDQGVDAQLHGYQASRAAEDVAGMMRGWRIRMQGS